MRAFALGIILLVGCALDPATSTGTQAISGGSCYDPVTYGALPWLPGVPVGSAPDSRPAIQAAVDAALAAGGGQVCLRAGRWFVTRAPAGSYNRFAAISTHGAGLELVGEGRETVIAAAGDAGASTFFIVSLDPGASDTTVRDLTIDTIGLYNTDVGEQTHAIAIGTSVCAGALCTTPITNTTIQRVRFLHAGAPTERWGDCVRVAGNSAATEARNTKLLDLDLLLCGRSGIAMQRNVNGLVISRSYFQGDSIGGSMIDGEATGGGFDRGLVIADNFLWRTLPGGDNFGVSMTSQIDFSVHDNVLIGRGITCVRCQNGSIHHNTFDASMTATLGVIDLANQAERVSVDGNKIIRRATGGAGPCIKAAPHAGVYPGPIDVSRNLCTNETDGAAILLDSINDAGVDGNILVGSGGPSSTGIYVQGSRPIAGLSIIANKLRNMTFAAVRLVSSAVSTYASTVIVGNVSRNSGTGLRCDNPQYLPAGGVVNGLNNWNTSAVCSPP